MSLDAIERALADLAAGRPVIVVDDASRENEGDLILAAELATPELLAFTIRHSSGVLCVALPGADLDRLGLPPMVAVNEDPKGTAYAVSVDARDGVSTGISAADRARTARLLADPGTTPADLTRPGHVFPLRAREGGVLVRRGHTEAAVDLTRLAGLRPAGLLVELVHDDGTMMRAPALREFADRHDLTMVSIEDLAAFRRRTEALVDRIATTELPTAYGTFVAHGYRAVVGAEEHLVLTMGDLGGDTPVLTRVHSECLTGDVLGSHRCDCGPQLDESLRRIAEAGRGVVVYLRGHEGRGIGLVAKLQAYALQQAGRDTVDANLDLGHPADARRFDDAAAILRDLGVTAVDLMTNNPDKVQTLERDGIAVAARVPLASHATVHNLDYLRTKRDRMGHVIDLPPSGTDLRGGR